jgi:hypothetical protein
MSFQIRKVALSRVADVTSYPDLFLQLRHNGSGYQAKIQTTAGNEPLGAHFHGRIRVETGKQAFEGVANWIVTMRRFVAVVESGMKSHGLDKATKEVLLVSATRDDLAAPALSRTLLGKAKHVAIRGVTQDFVIQVRYMANFEKFLETVTPAYIERLGPERAAERRAERMAKEATERGAAERAVAEQKHANAQRFGAGYEKEASVGGGMPSLGIMDHRRTWRFRLNAPVEPCIAAFEAAFTGRGGIVKKGKWSVQREPNGATAVYEGRRGIAVAGRMFETAEAEEDGALGSEVKFEIEEQGADYVICVMWLASRASRLGFTNDARFFRPHMRAVEGELGKLDASLKVSKD